MGLKISGASQKCYKSLKGINSCISHQAVVLFSICKKETVGAGCHKSVLSGPKRTLFVQTRIRARGARNKQQRCLNAGLTFRQFAEIMALCANKVDILDLVCSISVVEALGFKFILVMIYVTQPYIHAPVLFVLKCRTKPQIELSLGDV